MEIKNIESDVQRCIWPLGNGESCNMKILSDFVASNYLCIVQHQLLWWKTLFCGVRHWTPLLWRLMLLFLHYFIFWLFFLFMKIA